LVLLFRAFSPVFFALERRQEGEGEAERGVLVSWLLGVTEVVLGVRRGAPVSQDLKAAPLFVPLSHLDWLAVPLSNFDLADVLA
jgi:hypothetical protein